MISLALALALAPVASAGSHGTDRRLQATLAGVATFMVPPGCPPECSEFRTEGYVTGHETHLGLVTVRMSHRPHDVATVLDGSMTMVAANGDELHGVYDYTGDNQLVVFVTGGTGRFAEASGTIHVAYDNVPQFKPMPPCDPETDPFGCLNPDVPWPWWGTMSGTVSY